MTFRLFYWVKPNSREIHKASVIGSPLINIINSSISKSMFPRIWKVGSVSPKLLRNLLDVK